MVGSDSTNLQSWGCSYACACVQPLWEIPQVPDGNSLYQMRGRRRSYSASWKTQVQTIWSETIWLVEGIFSVFFFFEIDCRGQGYNLFFFLLHTLRNMSQGNSIYIPCSVAELLIFLWCKCIGERKVYVCNVCAHTRGCMWQRIVYILTFNRGQAPSTGKQTSRKKCLWSLIVFISDALTDVQEQHQVEIVQASFCFMYKKEQLQLC